MYNPLSSLKNTNKKSHVIEDRNDVSQSKMQSHGKIENSYLQFKLKMPKYKILNCRSTYNKNFMV